MERTRLFLSAQNYQQAKPVVSASTPGDALSLFDTVIGIQLKWLTECGGGQGQTTERSDIGRIQKCKKSLTVVCLAPFDKTRLKVLNSGGSRSMKQLRSDKLLKCGCSLHSDKLPYECL